jgi:hypothetical protein
MEKPLSPRRLAENEVFFRQQNRAIERGFAKLNKLAKEENHVELINDDDMLLQFYCECSNEICRQRISLRRSQYDQVHKADDKFVVICGHEIPDVEQIIMKTDDYCVIQKKMEPPKSSRRLNPSPISST